MKRLIEILLCGVAGVMLQTACDTENRREDVIADAKCEYAISPINVDTQMPRFNWTYSGNKGFVQHAFKIAVASEESKIESPDLWDSGEIVSGIPAYRMTDKGLLQTDKEYFWRVTAWNADSSMVITSGIEHFRTAFMNRSDWKAVWITDDKDKDAESAPMFRKEFDAGEEIRSARIYVSACAYAEVRLNGEKISNAFLDPGFTRYDKRNLYTVTEVADKLREGANVLSVVLGNGFYNEIHRLATWDFEKALWRNRARFVLELHIEHADGSISIVSSDGSWKTTADGPYVNNDIYSGDTYDARKEIAGWYNPGFDDTGLRNAVEVSDPSPVLVSQKMGQILPSEELAPVAIKNFGDTIHVFDFGKNISGLCRLEVEGKAGTELALAHAEILKADGRIEPGNINIYYYSRPGYGFQTDRYILKGGGAEEWTPSFSYHGFRYVEVKSNVPMKLDANSLTAIHFHTAMESVGSFGCSNLLLDTLCNMARRTYCNNFMSIPTDCPQREKNGWTADAYLGQEVGLLNFDGILAYEKWLDDFVDNQKEDGSISGIIPSSGWGYADWIGPVWDAALFIIPYNLYLYYGDKTAIDKVWPVCKKYLEYLNSREDELGLVYYGIGDWLPFDTKTPTDYTSALFYRNDYFLMSKFAEILGEDASAYKAKEEKLRNAVNRKFYDPKTGLYATGSQTGQAVALYWGIVPDSEIPKVVSGLRDLVIRKDGHLDFGSMGTKTVLRMLTKYGMSDLAFEMATKDDHPSWLSWIHDGLTTLPETWTMSPKFNDASLDHIFFGDICAWLVNDIVGIQKDDSIPGFGHIVLAPHFVKGLNYAKATYKSIRGEIKVEWHREKGQVIYKVSIPENTTATFISEDNSFSSELKCGENVLRLKDESNEDKNIQLTEVKIGDSTGEKVLAVGTEFDPHFYSQNVVGRDDASKPEDFRIIEARVTRMGVSRFRMMVLPHWWEPFNDNDDPFNTDFDKFHWNTVEMQSLCQILDLAQKNGIWVCLVLWGSQPGTSMIDESLSAKEYFMTEKNAKTWVAPPENDEEMGENFAALVKWLIDEKGYTCIKEITPFNEPDGNVCEFGHYNRICRALDNHFKRLGIRNKVMFNLSDNTDTRRFFLKNCTDSLSDVADIFNSHTYIFGYETHNDTIMKWEKANVALAKAAGKSHIVGEFGSNQCVGATRQKDIDFYLRGVFISRLALDFFNAGACGISYWSLIDQYYNRNASLSQMQQLGLWRYLKDTYAGTPNFSEIKDDYQVRKQYYAYSMLTKYIRPGSEIFPMEIRKDFASATAFKGEDGKWVYVIANQEYTPLFLRIENGSSGKFEVIRYKEDELPSDDSLLKPCKTLNSERNSLKIEVLPKTVVVCRQI